VRLSPRTASVVIPSFNYGRYLRNCIESALGQSHAPCEVIVVDDGSSDESHAIIESFGARILAVMKPNGGHASALNAGCRLAQGDVVFLLDADDELRPGAIDTVLSVWRPETVMVHWRPSQMDADGRDIAGTVPAPWIRLDEGDLRDRMLRTGGFSTTVTSGLALRRDVLLQVLPIPEDVFRQGADGYLVRAIAFHGVVQAIDRPLTRYRRHGENDSDLGRSPESVAVGLRKRIEFARNELGAVPQLARAHGLEAAAALGENNPEYLFVRLASVKVEPARHPIAGDAPARLLPRLIAAQWRSGRPLRARLAAAAYGTSIALLPRSLAWRVLAWRHSPAARPGWLSALATWRHRAMAR
jgi:hypothetical protein